MDWQKNRLWIGLAALLATGGAAYMAVSSRTGDSPTATAGSIENFPADLERDQIRTLEITQPEQPTVRLTRGDGGWTVSAPVEARADQTSVDTAIDKIVELELESIAARNASHHAELEVDAEHGIHVIARSADAVLADLWIGTTRSGNTAVRVEGQDAVGMVNGSIRFAFSRELKDWRDRGITDLESNDVREVAWRGPNGSFRFTRPMTTPAPAEDGTAAEPTLGDWTIAEVSYTPPAPPADPAAPAAAPPAATPMTTIANFQPSKVRTMVSTLARLRASDFAAADVTREAAGIGPESPTVTLTIGEGAQAVPTVLRLGNAQGDSFYAMREGDETIYVVSSMHASRIHPTASEFEASAAPAEPSEPSGAPPGIEIGGGEGGEIPPEIMRQIQQQLQQQGMGGAHP